MASCSQEQLLKFRWNDHIHCITKQLTTQRAQEQFCDVTLITDDFYVLKGHQAILSTTCGYFNKLFKDVTPDQHPIVVLRGANFKELSCLMEYIYQGVTHVDQKLMDSVLEVADMLEIKGLSKMRSNPSLKKLITTTNAQSPLASQIFHSSRSPSPPYSTSSITTSPLHGHCSTSKADNEEDDMVNIGTEDEFHEGRVATNHRNSGSQLEQSVMTEDLPTCCDANYSDQTSGIDLSISRSCCKESPQLFSEEEIFPRRPAIEVMEEEEEEMTDPNTDPDWGRISERDENPLPAKRKKFDKTVPLIKRLPVTTTEAKTTLKQSTLEKLAFLLAKQKDSNDSLNKVSGEKQAKKLPSLSDSSLLSFDQSDPHVEVSCGNGDLTISITTGHEVESTSSSIAATEAQTTANVSLYLRKGRRKTRSRKEMDEKRKKWLAKEKALLFSSDNSHAVVNKQIRKLSCLSSRSETSESVKVDCLPTYPSEQHHHSLSSSAIHEDDNVASYHSSDDRDNVHVTDKHNKDLMKKSKIQEEKKLQFPAISPLALFTLPPIKEREKQARTSLTIEEKIKVIEAFLDGKSQRQIAQLHGIGKTQVNGIIKKREEILSLYRESVVRGEKLTMKRQRKSEYASLNEHLIQWHRHMTLVAGMKITTGMLRAKALQIAPQLGYHDFKASNGWLATFKTNNNLKFSRAKKHTQPSYAGDGFQEEDDNHQEDDDFFEDVDAEESTESAPNNHNSDVGGNNEASSASHLVPVRGDPHTDTSLGQPGNSNLAVGNPALLSAGALGKVPQVSNMSLGTNLATAYNLTRDHTRGEIPAGPRGDIGHLSELHSSSAAVVNPGGTLPHPSLSKADGPLSYKSEDAISYGYDPQSRMNESAASRGSEYNYAHYSFPGSYYGYHFLGQY